MEKVTDITPKKEKLVKDLVADKDKPTVTKIMVEYSDGTKKELQQGVTLEMVLDPEDTKNARILIESLNLNRKEFITLTQGMFTLSCQILGIGDVENEPK